MKSFGSIGVGGRANPALPPLLFSEDLSASSSLSIAAARSAASTFSRQTLLSLIAAALSAPHSFSRPLQ